MLQLFIVFFFFLNDFFVGHFCFIYLDSDSGEGGENKREREREDDMQHRAQAAEVRTQT